MKEDGRYHFFYLFHRLEGKRVTKKEKRKKQKKKRWEESLSLESTLF